MGFRKSQIAIFLTLVRQFEMLGEEVTTLTLQKLAYLLQLKGEKLNLRFEKGYYGPYASNLNKVLEALSPNFINYQGDLSKPTTVINLVQDKKLETEEVINTKLSPDQTNRLELLSEMIEGFESTFGLELLATVGYALQQCPQCSKEEIIDDIQQWTKREKEIFTPHLISVSYDRIKESNMVVS